MLAQNQKSGHLGTNQPLSTEPPHILLVDDSFPRVAALRRALKQVGYSVEAASSCSDALALLKARTPDLVIVDGDLGDRNWGHGGLSANFIKEHLSGIKYGRLSGYVAAIPGDLHGEFAAESFGPIRAWLDRNLPVQGQHMAQLPPLPNVRDRSSFGGA